MDDDTRFLMPSRPPRMPAPIPPGRLYAMKVLQKAEMLKRDQNAMSLPSQRRLRSCNCIIRFKILYICTWSWSSYRGGDLMTMQMKYDVFSEDVTRFYMHGQVYARH
ncbi:hypothetical protein EI94DRAFT_811648 [Lactarius quietus]|nr:hypothetical protein EI94DRAFT_811648 [Lactarius quietus]